ncbi:hypothetical protein [Prosthecobacter dejongeii]|uniref:hypothetical protein n=1 Tax=Prosthecobacter dejongeii TaxID=48465 RepID=UPI001C8657CF|nr:hypothetical protein [Prosthecobacter dejongeii]
MNYFQAAAVRQNARLTGISSIARGGDVLFAQECLRGDGERPPLPWKCVLPFEQDGFLRQDLEKDEEGRVLPVEEGALRGGEARACLEGAFEILVLGAPGAVPERETTEIVAAYMECGYRIVDEADVMICLLRNDEFLELAAATNPGTEVSQRRNPLEIPCSKAGTLAMARYAIAGRRPCILLNMDAVSPWQTREMRNDPEAGRHGRAGCLFYDEIVTPLVRRCEGALPAGIIADGGDMPQGPVTVFRESLLVLQQRLGGLANHHRKQAVGGLKRMLTLHLMATGIAALAATALAFDRPHEHPAGLLGFLILSLALMKPALAFWAQRIEEHLHHHHERESWLHARILAELCRGALSLWPMPEQPMDAADEEDFPKLKRLLRTLRLLRVMDEGAAVKGQSPRPALNAERPWQGETVKEANMREAVRLYVQSRLEDQAAHYEKKQKQALAEERCWHRSYQVAIWTAILLGGLTFVLKVAHVGHGEHSYLDVFNWLAVPVILAPFVATYALGMITINDCRRRAKRYRDMHHYLRRLAATLTATQANSSRLRLVEHAERMLIEEQHEWFSVTRNYSV